MTLSMSAKFFLLASLLLLPAASFRAEAAPLQYPVEAAFGGVSFQEPVQVVFAPGETNRAFVVERAGRIAMVPNLAQPARQVILDLSSTVNVLDPDHGMLSMAFHPNFAQNGFFYVWTSMWTGGTRYMQLMRFTLTSNNTVDPASALTLISQQMGRGGHDGGTILFGTDGYLYLSIGDGDQGAAGAEAVASHQHIDRGFFGGVIRIDVDKRPGNLAANAHLSQAMTGYLVPADNPFVGATSFNGQPVDPSQVRTEFWAVGLRNPWRMSFDANGDLWAADVGLSTEEEVDIISRGNNYGWNFLEGTGPGPDAVDTPQGISFTAPIWQYDHSQGDVCIIGGMVYHGALFPELQGQYLFCDYQSGRIWAAANPGTRPIQSSQVTQIASEPGITGLTVQPGTGDILFANLASGVIQRLGTANTTIVAPTIGSQPVSQTVASGGTVVFSISAGGIPTPAYQWSLNGTLLSGATGATLVVGNVDASSAGSYACTVSNSAGAVNSAPAVLTVTSTSNPGQLINISTRAPVGTGANVLIAGFVISGATARTVLIRGSGPALIPLGIPGTLPDPRVTLFSGNTAIASNTGWGGNAQVASAAAATGAFAWSNPASADSALLITLAPGAYTAQVAGASGDTGVALIEVYQLP